MPKILHYNTPSLRCVVVSLSFLWHPHLWFYSLHLSAVCALFLSKLKQIAISVLSHCATSHIETYRGCIAPAKLHTFIYYWKSLPEVWSCGVVTFQYTFVLPSLVDFVITQLPIGVLSVFFHMHTIYHQLANIIPRVDTLLIEKLTPLYTFSIFPLQYYLYCKKIVKALTLFTCNMFFFNQLKQSPNHIFLPKQTSYYFFFFFEKTSYYFLFVLLFKILPL